MAGIDSKKEYRAANSRSRPSSSPAAMVLPEREIPGVMASPCTTPIKNDREQKILHKNHQKINQKSQVDFAKINRMKANFDKTEKKFSENKRKLSLYPKNELPQYILNNESKFKEWLD